MNEFSSSWLNLNTLIIVAEIAALLAILLIVIFVVSYRKRNKMKSLTADFLEEVKKGEVEREQALKKKFEETTDLAVGETELLVAALVKAEKDAYLHIAQLYMGYKPESLIDLEDEIKNISGNYLGIIETVSKNSTGSSGGEDDDSAMRELKKQVTNLREEKKSLKLKNAQLQIDFEASVDSIERMTTEFANMYEGGSKDGEKRIKNEMYQLRQILAKKMDATSVDGDFDADLTVDEIPDMDVDSGSADQIDEEKPDEAAAK